MQAGLAELPICTTSAAPSASAQRFNRFEVTAQGHRRPHGIQDSQLRPTARPRATRTATTTVRRAAAHQLRADAGLKPFVEVGADTREHDSVRPGGVQRDSIGMDSRKAGTTFEFSRKLTGEISRRLSDARLQGSDAAGPQRLPVDASLIWFVTALTNVKLTAATTVAARSTVPGVSGVFTRDVGLQVDHAFRRWLIGAVKFNYGIDDYVGSTRKDDRYSRLGGAHLQAQPR